MPVTPIDPSTKASELAFNLTEFDLNPVTIASNDVSMMGYNVEFPAFVRTQDKTITFNYLLDSELTQYRFLYKWISKIAVEEGSGHSPNAISTADYMVPIRVSILSEFKNRPFEFVFENSWISELGPLAFAYQEPEASPVRHSFTIKYSQLSFNVQS